MPITTTRKTMGPQDFLDVVESAAKKLSYASFYLIEYNKPRVQSIFGGLEIQIDRLTATHAKFLKWDYGLGDEVIGEREFLIMKGRYAHHYIVCRKQSEDLSLGRVFQCVPRRISRSLLGMEDLSNRYMDKKIEVIMHPHEVEIEERLGAKPEESFYLTVLRSLQSL